MVDVEMSYLCESLEPADLKFCYIYSVNLYHSGNS